MLDNLGGSGDPFQGSFGELVVFITQKSSLKRQLKAEALGKKSSSEEVVLSTRQRANNARRIHLTRFSPGG